MDDSAGAQTPSPIERIIRAKAEAHEGPFVAAMPSAAQETRAYADYLGAKASSDPVEIDYLAASVIGPNNRTDKIVGHLPLMP